MKFNPDFWEVTISSESWQRFSTEDAFSYESSDDAHIRHKRDEYALSLGSKLRAIVSEVLTERQQEVVELYFFYGLNQHQIGKCLGITKQSVREHLYGKVRSGRAIGGAIRKLRKACASKELRWP